MFWTIKEFLDEIFFLVHNLANSLRLSYFKILNRKLIMLSNERFIDVNGNLDNITIVANGPSSSDFTERLGTQLIFVNFGYKHCAFINATNPLLVIVDKKLSNGSWSLQMLYDAYELNQTVQFAFGGHLLTSHDIREFANSHRCCFIFNDLNFTRFSKAKKYRVGDIAVGGGATESAIMLAASLGAQKIDVFGFDGNNVVLGLAGLDTHFYGSDPMKDWSEPKFVARELRFLSYFIDKNRYLSYYLASIGVELINHTETEYMKIFEQTDEER